MKKVRIYNILDQDTCPLVKLLFEMYDLQPVEAAYEDADLVILSKQADLTQEHLSSGKLFLVMESEQSTPQVALPENQVFVYRAWLDELGITAIPYWLGKNLPK